MENLRLRESLAELQRFLEPAGEREQLLGDLSALRDKMLELLEAGADTDELEAAAEKAAIAGAAHIEEAAAHAEALKVEQMHQVMAASAYIVCVQEDRRERMDVSSLLHFFKLLPLPPPVHSSQGRRQIWP